MKKFVNIYDKTVKVVVFSENEEYVHYKLYEGKNINIGNSTAFDFYREINNGEWIEK